MSISVVGRRLDINGDDMDEDVDILLFECRLIERKRPMLPLDSSASAGTVTVDGCILEDADRIDIDV